MSLLLSCQKILTNQRAPTMSHDSKMSDEEKALLLILLLRRRRRSLRLNSRRIWMKKWIQRRLSQGAYANLVREVNDEDPETFRQFHRLDRESFQFVLSMVGPLIQKKNTNMRESVAPGERLAVTLRFLATGESFRSLSFQFRLGERTVSDIVNETCQAVFHVMKGSFMKVPSSEEEWESVAEDFKKQWNYPCCLGALDGKHIAINKPEDSGSEYFNYKHFFSVLLLALVDANYRFLYVNVGASGRAGDAGVFCDSDVKAVIDSNSLNIPPSKPIPACPKIIDYHIIGDDAFGMSKRLMKPYPHRNLDHPKKIFNYRLSRARRVVENAFGILANRFRVFLSTINLCHSKVENVILAACALHNFMVINNKHSYTSASDVEDAEEHVLTPGIWRGDPALVGMSVTPDRNPTRDAKEQRNKLTDYFLSERGSVPWQDSMI